MADISADQLRHLCKLARLEIDRAERERLVRDLGRILDYMRVLAAVNTTGVEPLLPAGDRPPELRSDRVRPGARAREALRSAPERAGEYFAVPPLLPPVEKDEA